jgi:hypothetical protein
MPPAPRRGSQQMRPVKPVSPPFDGAASGLSGVAPLAQPGIFATLAATTMSNLDGIGNGFVGPNGSFTVATAPPDPSGDVDPNHYVQTVNTDFAVFDKSGTPIYGPVALNTLWSSAAMNVATAAPREKPTRSKR